MAQKETKLFGDFDVVERAVPFGEWFKLVVAWDGVLPIVVVGVPLLANWAWPGQHLLQDLVCVLVIIIVFLIRLAVGLSHISRNHCRPRTRVFQKVVLSCAVFLFVVFDVLMVAMQGAVLQGVGLRPEEQLLIAVVYTVYLIVMAFALYPGKRVVTQEDQPMF